jgi:hypothetical protein
MLKHFVLFILAFGLAVTTAKAEPYRRSVEFEWDQIEGAKSYDLELKRGKKTLNFSTKTPAWNGRLAPGIFQMRLRAKDHRGVPAPWSDPEEFRVYLEQVQIQSPADSSRIQTSEDSKAEVTFQWKPVSGAKAYYFELQSEAGEALEKEESLKDTKVTFKLAVARNYKWKVKALGPETDSEEETSATFSLIGAPLVAPELREPESDFVRELKWTAPKHASNYSYILNRLNPQTRKWEKVSESQSLTENRFEFDPNLPGGRYRFSLNAAAPLRKESKKSQMDFDVRSGDRSPAAEETFTLRQSIDRLSGWYAIASYLITIIDYQGANFDRSNSNLKYSAIGGTGRLGAGYLSPKTDWGFLGIADLSGMTIDGGNTFTFASLEASGIYRRTVGVAGEWRQHLGLFYKELPETVGKTSTSIVATNLLKVAGPHYGTEFWWAMTPKLGLQVNAHLYPNLLKLQTPGGAPLRTTFSYQVGLLGSYRLQKRMTGLAGYAYRVDQANYEAQAGQGSARAGDFNSVSLSGHYLNLFLEWAL